MRQLRVLTLKAQGPRSLPGTIHCSDSGVGGTAIDTRLHGETDFNTTYWFVTPQEGEGVRFTTTMDAFYILTLSTPNQMLVLEPPMPCLETDNVTVVGGNRSRAVVPAQMLCSGALQLEVSEDQNAWVFKVTY